MKKKWIAAISSVVLGCSTVMMPFASSFTVNAADTRSGLVTTNGTQFMLDGSTFYYAGTNNYYLNFKPKESVDAVLEDAAEMGLKVVRTWGNLDAGVKTDKVSDKGYTVFTDSVDGSGEKEGVYYQYSCRLSSLAYGMEKGLRPALPGGSLSSPVRGSLTEASPSGISAGYIAVRGDRGKSGFDCGLRKGCDTA